jgi:ABC-type sugar transport system substrate-binding protein
MKLISKITLTFLVLSLISVPILTSCARPTTVEETASTESVAASESAAPETAAGEGKVVKNEAGEATWEGSIPFQPAKEGEKVIVGQVVLTMLHEYQIRRTITGKKAAEELGVTLLQDSSEMDASKLMTIVENMIQKGAKAIAFTQTDAGAGVAVADLCAKKGVAIVLEVQDNPDVSYPWPLLSVIESDHNAGPGGEFAANLFNEKFGKDAKAVLASLRLQAYTVCDLRNKSFEEAFIKIHPNTEVIQEEGGGQREPGLKAMETLLQAHPDINVLFGCNDDSTLGAMGALNAAGKTKDDVIVIGYDGTLAGYDELKKSDSLYLADVAQDPEEAGYWEVKIAAEAALGLKNPGDYPRHNLANKTYLVTAENVDQYYELAKAGQPEKK